MELMIKAVAHLEMLAREARARGDEDCYEALIIAQNSVLHAVLISAQHNARKVIVPQSERSKLSLVS